MVNDKSYLKIANKKDLEEGALFKVESSGKSIVLSMVNGIVYAMDAVCSHEGGPLEEGILEGYNLKCPWHSAIFDIRNAKVSDQTPWATDLNSYTVKIDEDSGDILVNLETSTNENKDTSYTPSIKEKSDTVSQYQDLKKEEQNENKLSLFNLVLLEKQKVEGTDIMSFKFSKRISNYKKIPQEEQQKEQQQQIQNQLQLDYTAGQYAIFDIGQVYNDPEGPVRYFTIASSPTENYIMISTRIRDTPFKKRLSTLEEGTKIEIKGPEGQFTLHDDYSKYAIFLSGGIGVTPFRSMIKNVTDMQLPIKIVMFDSNRNYENILYKKEFDECANINKNLKIIYTITDEESKENEISSSSNEDNTYYEHGRINKAMILKYVDNNKLDRSIFYSCGPPGMVKAMQELLQNDLQIPKDRIKTEEFTGY